ncbi:MAG: AraC family transcriptional regulator [Bacteroidota bacterium]
MVFESNQEKIPSLELTHNNEPVHFAFRTMEEIEKRTRGKPDRPHRHQYYTVLWAKKACGLHYIDFVEYPIEPSIIFFVNPGQVHQVVPFPNPEGIVIMFTTEFLVQNQISTDFIRNLGLFSDLPDTPPIKIDDHATKTLTEITNNIKNAFYSDHPYKEEMLGAYLKLFLIECNRFSVTAPTNNTQTLQSGKIILGDFKALVERQFKAWHKVNNYADELSITPDYLNNLIKSILGKTAKTFIQERITLEAKRLGIHTQLSSKEIAYELGFDDPSHFSKFFKNTTGQSFSDFRTKTDMAKS